VKKNILFTFCDINIKLKIIVTDATTIYSRSRLI
jgi:hypothetical protein